MAGLDASRISFTADTVSINWQGLSFDTNTVVTLDVGFGTVAPKTVPTLSEWGVITLSSLLALGMIFALRRQRK